MAKNKKFRKLLRERNMKHKALAERLGVSVRTVEYWMNGRNRPSMIHVISMAKMFGMEIEILWGIFKT